MDNTNISLADIENLSSPYEFHSICDDEHINASTSAIHNESNSDNIHLGHLFPVNSETKLSQYTDNHFVHRLNEDLEKIRNMATTFVPSGSLRNYPRYIHSNSPLTLSNDNSDSDNDINPRVPPRRPSSQNSSFHRSFHMQKSKDAAVDEPNILSSNASFSGIDELNQSKFRNLTHQEVEQYLDKYYDEKDTNYSSELDILITYMKGQKNLYIQSKIVSEYKLNALLIPSILTTAAITIFAPFIQQYGWSGGFISGLNAITTLLITIANYLKLESSTQTFYHTANQYDKLETSLEFVASKMLFVQDDAEKSRIVLQKIQEIEKKISEIKEWNSLFVPEQVRRMFPIICHINIFSFIKRMEVYKKNLVVKFKDVKNEIRYIIYHFSKEHIINDNDKTPNRLRQEQRLQFLLEIKDKMKEELSHYRTAYSHIDELFTKEIKSAQQKNEWNWTWYKTPYLATHTFDQVSRDNPVIDQYLRFMSNQ